MSVSLHFKKENKNLKYGVIFGWAENLTLKVRIYLFIGFTCALIGANLGTL